MHVHMCDLKKCKRRVFRLVFLQISIGIIQHPFLLTGANTIDNTRNDKNNSFSNENTTTKTCTETRVDETLPLLLRSVFRNFTLQILCSDNQARLVKLHNVDKVLAHEDPPTCLGDNQHVWSVRRVANVSEEELADEEEFVTDAHYEEYRFAVVRLEEYIVGALVRLVSE